VKLTIEIDFTAYTTIGELSLGITIAQHMAIPRTNSNGFVIQINITI